MTIRLISATDHGDLCVSLPSRELEICLVCLGNATAFVDEWRNGDMFGWDRTLARLFHRSLVEKTAGLKREHGFATMSPDSDWTDPDRAPIVQVTMSAREARLIADTHFAVLIAIDEPEFSTIVGYSVAEVRRAGGAWIQVLREAGCD